MDAANKALRIIAERRPDGGWSVRLENEPKRACGGPSVVDALKRWLALNRQRFPGPYSAQLDQRESTLDRRVILLSAAASCPDCGGSGRYVGLVVVEDCRTCRGTGLVAR